MRRADPASRQVTPSQRLAQEKTGIALGRVGELEDLLNVQARWAPESEEYTSTLVYIGERKYRIALDHLERLVVQRMFELEKTNLVGTST